MASIFISYRREDSQGEALHLCEDLKANFVGSRVFLDVTGIEPGKDFRRVIESTVITCDALIVMIGRKWIDAVDEDGNRRLENPRDFVRIETAAALHRDVPVIPVLVQGATVPRQNQLPQDMEALVWRHAFELRHARWNADVAELVSGLQKTVPALSAGNSEGATNKPWWKSVAAARVVGAVSLVLTVGAALLGMFTPEQLDAPRSRTSLVGKWVGNSPCTVVIHKDDGKIIEGNCDVGGFRHRLTGTYLDADRLTLVITRTDPNHCSTSVEGSIEVVDTNHLRTSQDGWNGCNVKTGPAVTDLARL